MRIDEKTVFERIVTTDGDQLEGQWTLHRAVGELGFASPVLAVDGETGCMVPLTSIKIMAPQGALTPNEHAEAMAVSAEDV